MTTMVIATSICLLVECATGSLSTDLPQGLLIPVSVFLIILNVPLLILDLNLATFHIMITAWGMTTLEYLRACNAWEKNQILAAEHQHQSIHRDTPSGKRDFKPFPFCVEWVIFRKRPLRPAKLGPQAKSSMKASNKKVLPMTELDQQASGKPTALLEVEPKQPSLPWAASESLQDSALAAATQPELASAPVMDSALLELPPLTLHQQQQQQQLPQSAHARESEQASVPAADPGQQASEHKAEKRELAEKLADETSAKSVVAGISETCAAGLTGRDECETSFGQQLTEST